MLTAPKFAYLFERFPSFTQTFCAREVAQMRAQATAPQVFSIRGAEPTPDSASSNGPEYVHYLPQGKELKSKVAQLKEARMVPESMSRLLQNWKQAGDKSRLYEAAYLGPLLREAQITHVHAHFAGLATRTAYWLHTCYGISYSFTGHANDIFVQSGHSLGLEELVENARFVVTETEFSSNWLRSKLPNHASKIHRVYNGLDVQGFPIASLETSPFRIVSVGRYIEKKGFEDLIQACHMLSKQCLSFSCRIIGAGPLESALREQVCKLGLQAKVTICGPRGEQEVQEELAAASLFVLPCVPERDGAGMDNLPTVIMEAMAAGLPVVSTRVAGIPEMVLPNETGVLVEPRSPALLSAAISRLATDRGLLRAMGSKSRQIALEKFSIAVTTQILKRLLVEHLG